MLPAFTGRETMFKMIFAAAALVASLSAPAFAAGMMACDDASIMKTEEMAKGMTDPMKKDQDDDGHEGSR